MQLSHPNLVRVFDLVGGGAAETAAIAMEFVDGKSLTGLRLEKPNRIFDAAELTPWIGQACGALEHAHTDGRLVHRDLKPANLMVDSRGQLRVMDFGIASSLSESMSRHSRAGQPAASTGGTLPYMSPQQLMGCPPAVADDVYSLGATLCELLTGKPPFFRGNLAGQIESVTPPPMAERRAELENAGAPIPAAWEQTVAACLEKELARRPKSVAEVWERLGGGQHGGPRGPGSGKKASSTDAGPFGTRQNAYRIWMLAGLIAGAVACGSFLFWQAENRTEKTTQEQQPGSAGSSGNAAAPAAAPHLDKISDPNPETNPATPASAPQNPMPQAARRIADADILFYRAIAGRKEPRKTAYGTGGDGAYFLEIDSEKQMLALSGEGEYWEFGGAPDWTYKCRFKAQPASYSLQALSKPIDSEAFVSSTPIRGEFSVTFEPAFAEGKPATFTYASDIVLGIDQDGGLHFTVAKPHWQKEMLAHPAATIYDKEVSVYVAPGQP